MYVRYIEKNFLLLVGNFVFKKTTDIWDELNLNMSTIIQYFQIISPSYSQIWVQRKTWGLNNFFIGGI
jgi:hypothetical protein